MYKQIILIRTDLRMSKGKTAVQCAHASVSVLDKVDRKTISLWKRSGQKKITLKAKNEKELKEIKSKCDSLNLDSYLVRDAGLTELEPGTATALAIGPDDEGKIDKVTGSLPLLR